MHERMSEWMNELSYVNCMMFSEYFRPISRREKNAWPTERRADGRTDKPFYRDAQTHLKTLVIIQLGITHLKSVSSVWLAEDSTLLGLTSLWNRNFSGDSGKVMRVKIIRDINFAEHRNSWLGCKWRTAWRFLKERKNIIISSFRHA